MAIQEAIKSGKNFRRKTWPEDIFFTFNPTDAIIRLCQKDAVLEIDSRLSIKNVLAEDWELITN